MEGVRNTNGTEGLAKFLHPRNLVIPLIKLPDTFARDVGENVRIYAALCFLNAAQNHKMIPAAHMLLEAKERGWLTGVHTLVEATSGNTGLALAIVARAFKLAVELYVRSDTPLTKVGLLEVHGAHVSKFAELPGDMTCAQRAREIGSSPGYLNLDQYGNPHNPEAFARYLAPKLFEQFGGDVSVVSAGVGTGGTLIGIANYVRAQSIPTALVGVVCGEGPEGPVPGVRPLSRLNPPEVRLPWRKAIGEENLVCIGSRARAYQASLDLQKVVGAWPGPSSGLAYVGLIEFLERCHREGGLDELRSPSGYVNALFICPDTGHNYLDKYSTILDAVG